MPVAEDLFERIESSLVAAACGDALGWITEMNRHPDSLRNLFGIDWLTDFQDWEKSAGAGGRRRYADYVRRGEYSDDTQLTLAVFRSLRGDGSFDGDHFTQRELAMWLDYARGAGAASVGAALAAQRKPVLWYDNFFTYGHRGGRNYRSAGGNGAAMRVSPIALANLRRPDRMAEGVWKSAAATHGHPTAIVGALLYASALRLCLERRKPIPRPDFINEIAAAISEAAPPQTPEFEQWLNVWNSEAHHTREGLPFEELLADKKNEVTEHLERLAQLPDEPRVTRDYMDCTVEHFGSGTETTLAALAIFLQDRDDPRQAIPWTVNQLGYDTDTIGGFVGGLIGAAYGREAIPTRWFADIQDSAYFTYMARCLEFVICVRSDPGQTFLPIPTKEDQQLPQLPDCLSSEDLSEEDRAFHPIFGAGQITDIETQPENEIRLTRVTFDQTQSCKFKYKIERKNHND